MPSDFACRLYKLFKAADAAGQHVCILSAYRGIASQTILWNAALQKYGSIAEARKHVAPPGNSMHNKGLAADLCFPGDTASNWVHQNIKTFNLYFRLGYEPWHVEPSTAISGSGGTGPGTSTLTPGVAAAAPTATPSRNPDGTMDCPPEYMLIGNQCVFPQSPIQCPLGYVLISSVCIPYPTQPNISTSPSIPGIPSSVSTIPPFTSAPSTNPYISGNSFGTPGATLSMIPSSILGQLNQSNSLNLYATISTSSNALIDMLGNRTASNVPTTNTPSDIIAQLNASLMNGITITNVGGSTQGSNTFRTGLTTQSLTPTQTFTGDNPDNSSYSPTSTIQSSYFQTTLASLQSVLILILGYLQGLLR